METWSIWAWTYCYMGLVLQVLYGLHNPIKIALHRTPMYRLGFLLYISLGSLLYIGTRGRDLCSV
jgi:hypothetical protein